jgi:hypothetical protein
MEPHIHLETLHDPTRYSFAQVQRAKRIAYVLGRGRLVLCEAPHDA